MRKIITVADFEGKENLFDVHELDRAYRKWDRYSWRAEDVPFNYSYKGPDVIRVNYVIEGDDEKIPVETLPKIAQEKLLQAAISYHAQHYKPKEKPALAPVPGRKLTPRQQECKTLLAEGLSVQEVADKIGISASSVLNYLREAIPKDQLTNGYKPDSRLIRQGR